MIHNLQVTRQCLWVVATILGLVFDAAALEISTVYTGDFDNRTVAKEAMRQAVAVWEIALSDPIEVEFEVRDAPELPLSTAGATIIPWTEAAYSEVREALVANITSPNDRSATQHLPDGASFVFQSWNVERDVVTHDRTDWINNHVALTPANAKALGLPTDDGADAEILWSPFFLDHVFDYDRTDGVDGIDFLGVAVHEIGHALGFASAVDDFDIVFAGEGWTTREDLLQGEWSVIPPLDFFRFSDTSKPLPDITPGADSYFSIDGGATSLGKFATGEFFGDGWQAGHWKYGSGLGILEPFFEDNVIYELSELDLQAMDVIGWDLVASGDFNNDGIFSVDDIDLLKVSSNDLTLDLNRDGLVNQEDRIFWIHVFANTYFGDSNLDGEFGTSDLVAVFITGEYEDAIPGNSTWSTGDWNGDGDFTTSDLVIAFEDGGYERGPRTGLNAVPEPSAVSVISIAILGLTGRRFPRHN